MLSTKGSGDPATCNVPTLVVRCHCTAVPTEMTSDFVGLSIKSFIRNQCWTDSVHPSIMDKSTVTWSARTAKKYLRIYRPHTDDVAAQLS